MISSGNNKSTEHPCLRLQISVAENLVITTMVVWKITIWPILTVYQLVYFRKMYIYFLSCRWNEVIHLRDKPHSRSIKIRIVALKYVQTAHKVVEYIKTIAVPFISILRFKKKADWALVTLELQVSMGDGTYLPSGEPSPRLPPYPIKSLKKTF